MQTFFSSPLFPKQGSTTTERGRVIVAAVVVMQYWDLNSGP
jgi:hypothetical protein